MPLASQICRDRGREHVLAIQENFRMDQHYGFVGWRDGCQGSILRRIDNIMVFHRLGLDHFVGSAHLPAPVSSKTVEICGLGTTDGNPSKKRSRRAKQLAAMISV